MPKSRRTLLSLLLLLALLALATLAILRSRAPHRQAASSKDPRPNIVLIVTDDQDLLLGSLDFMPAVRNQIGAQGLTFTNDFVPLSLCCPSRASILTGQYAHNH